MQLTVYIDTITVPWNIINVVPYKMGVAAVLAFPGVQKSLVPALDTCEFMLCI